MPDRPSSSRGTSNLRLLFGLVAGLLGLAMVGASVSDPLLAADPMPRFAVSRAPAIAASAGTPTAAALAIRRTAWTARRDLMSNDANPHDPLPSLATLLRGTPLERPPGHPAALDSSPPLPVLWLPPPPSPAVQPSPQHGLTPRNRIHGSSPQDPAPAATPGRWRSEWRHPIDGEPISAVQETPASS